MARRLTVWNPWTMIPDDPFGYEPIGLNEIEGVSMDMYEEGDDVIVKIKAPGFDKDDVKIQIESNIITISGSKEEEGEKKDKNRKYYRKEIRSTSFSRTVELPSSVKASDAKAVSRNGMLTITLPKREEAKPKTISIDVA